MVFRIINSYINRNKFFIRELTIDMKKTFEVTYNGSHIEVVNSWFGGEKLYVNGQLQDENLGLGLRGILNGELKNTDDRKKIKVALGGTFKIKCKIFVDNELIYPKEG